MHWSLSRYNAIVYPNLEDNVQTGGHEFPADRLFERTDADIREIYENDLASLSDLPTLILSEVRSEWRPAYIGRISDIQKSAANVYFHFQPLYYGLGSAEIFESPHFDFFIRDRGIDDRRRTHWAVKRGNLLEAVFKLISERAATSMPRTFNVERWPLPNLGHVAVMMPFSSEFAPIYDAIKAVCKDRGLKALRVDEIYSPTKIKDDIFSAIAQSCLVISDLTDRNANVLYETGLAHALNRDVVMLVQNDQDVPFDLRDIRYIKYLPNDEGLDRLKSDLSRFVQGYQ